jgi:hypothetical protein
MGISRFYLPTRFIIGTGSLAQLGTETSRLGKTALVTTGKSSLRRTGVLDKILKDLEEKGVSATVFDKVEPNPRASTIDEGAVMARDNKVEVVIGIGGGSTMDAAKCIALAAGGSDPIWAHYEGKAAGKPRALPIILVPTMAASGSEANNGAVFTRWETHEKVVIMNPQTYPRTSIVDPALTLTLPARQTAQGGVDIFCHLVENYITAAEPNLINDSLREACMRTVVESLPAVLAKLDDIQHRERLSWASTIACSQFAGLGGGSGFMTMHGIEHALSGAYDIAHGDGLAALLVAWMKHTYTARQNRFKTLAQNVFGKPDAIKATEDWLKQVGMNLKLKDLGVNEAEFASLAENALRTAMWVKFHPAPMDEQSIAGIYRACY